MGFDSQQVESTTNLSILFKRKKKDKNRKEEINWDVHCILDNATMHGCTMWQESGVQYMCFRRNLMEI